MVKLAYFVRASITNIHCGPIAVYVSCLQHTAEKSFCQSSRKESDQFSESHTIVALAHRFDGVVVFIVDGSQSDRYENFSRRYMIRLVSPPFE